MRGGKKALCRNGSAGNETHILWIFALRGFCLSQLLCYNEA